MALWKASRARSRCYPSDGSMIQGKLPDSSCSERGRERERDGSTPKRGCEYHESLHLEAGWHRANAKLHCWQGHGGAEHSARSRWRAPCDSSGRAVARCARQLEVSRADLARHNKPEAGSSNACLYLQPMGRRALSEPKGPLANRPRAPSPKRAQVGSTGQRKRERESPPREAGLQLRNNTG